MSYHISLLLHFYMSYHMSLFLYVISDENYTKSLKSLIYKLNEFCSFMPNDMLNTGTLNV